MDGELKFASLSEQVYEYLREHWSFDYQKEFIYTFYEGQYESD